MAFSIVANRKATKFSELYDQSKLRSHKESMEFWGMFLVVGCVADIIMFIVAVGTVLAAISKILNPEFAAINEMMAVAKGLFLR